MENLDKQKKVIMISIIVLVIVIFVGIFSYILLQNSQKNTQEQIKKTENQAGAQLKTKSGFRLKVLTTEPQIGQEVRIAVYANSGKQDVMGFDLALSYPEMLAYIGSSSTLEGYDVIETTEENIIDDQKGSKIIITGAKQLGNNKSAIWDDSEIMILKFKPMRSGLANLTFEMSPGSLSDTNMFDNYNKDLVTIAVGSTVQIP